MCLSNHLFGRTDPLLLLKLGIAQDERGLLLWYGSVILGICGVRKRGRAKPALPLAWLQALHGEASNGFT
jgi:hypothetical protein